jgi:hypothetical protein
MIFIILRSWHNPVTKWVQLGPCSLLSTFPHFPIWFHHSSTLKCSRRLFGFQGKVHYGEKGCVTHVYFGSRIHAKNRAKVIGALAPFGINTSKMTVGEYFIDFDDLNPE